MLCGYPVIIQVYLSCWCKVFRICAYFTSTSTSSLTDSPTAGAVGLTAVLSGVAVSSLLLALLIAGIIARVVLLRRAKRKEGSLQKRSPSVKSMECLDKELKEPQGKVEESTAGNECEHCIDDVRVEQYVEELNHESANVLRKGSLNRVEGNRIRCNGDFDEIDAAEILSRDWDRHGTVDEDLQVDQPTDTPDAVYAVVDKSRKKKKGKTEGDQSTTATQDPYTEVQHYESSTVLGMDWVQNEVNSNEDVGETKKGSSSDDLKVTGLSV